MSFVVRIDKVTTDDWGVRFALARDRRRHFGLAVHATLEAGSGTIGGVELLSDITEHPWAAGCVMR